MCKETRKHTMPNTNADTDAETDANNTNTDTDSDANADTDTDTDEITHTPMLYILRMQIQKPTPAHVRCTQSATNKPVDA
jgi:hypothetical protein